VLFFALSINGEQAIARMFHKAPAVVSNMQPEMFKVGRVVQERFAEVFRAEGAVPGQPRWTPLSEKWTVPERIAEGFAGRRPILVRTTGYRRSFQTLAIGAMAVTVGSRDVRDALLQLGGKTGLGRLVPPRPITARVRAAFERNQYREIVDILRKGLMERLGWDRLTK
jgi:phage gpG-like protein